MLDLLFIGHLTRDRIVDAAGVRSETTGGAVYYGSLPARLLDLEVGVLTKVAEGDKHLLDELVRAGVQVATRPSAVTTTIEITAKTPDFERRRFVVEAVADPFALEDLAGVQARAIVVCPLMRGEFPGPALPWLAARAAVALDVQGFVRCRSGEGLRSADWPDKQRLLSAVTYLKADRREAELLTGLADIEAAARALHDLGAAEVLISHTDGLHLLAAGVYRHAPFTARSTPGRTGRGDTAIATYVARRLQRAPGEALRFAADVVSRKLARPGPFRGPL